MIKGIPFAVPLACLVPILGCAPSGETPAPASRDSFVEASGVARLGDDLLLVGDEDGGAVHRFHLPGDTTGPRIPIPPEALTREAWPASALALDLEGIAVLPEGRVVVLSEQLAALVDRDGIVVEYGGAMNEFGGRGLEGVAVRDLGEGVAGIAVLWEGGYPSRRNLPEALRDLGIAALEPVVWIHELGPGERGLSLDRGDVREVRLQVPRPEGEEPAAQRFRAPDLVWHRTAEGAANGSELLLVLISSGNATPHPEYRYHWIQAFTTGGRPVGPPLDLDQLAPEDLRGVNWEGMTWFEAGRSLALVFEHDPDTLPLAALVVPLPEGWPAP